jgi:integrase
VARRNPFTKEYYTGSDPLTSEEAHVLFKSIDNIPDYTLIITGINTGMRISEISSLEEISINEPEGPHLG